MIKDGGIKKNESMENELFSEDLEELMLNDLNIDDGYAVTSKNEPLVSRQHRNKDYEILSIKASNDFIVVLIKCENSDQNNSDSINREKFGYIKIKSPYSIFYGNGAEKIRSKKKIKEKKNGLVLCMVC